LMRFLNRFKYFHWINQFKTFNESTKSGHPS
jgi:hypothetical protein